MMSDVEKYYCVFVTIALGLCIYCLIFAMDNSDVDDTIAPLMCKSYNMAVERVEQHCLGLGSDNSMCPEGQILRIYCKNSTIIPIEDSYLLVKT